ncbi:MAG: hypothetical protein MUO29_01900 [Desulfobacterales bacterium]|nr:hypothetical protein [Desulfobacterales bacterium]
MEPKARKAFLVLFIISVTLFFGPQLLWAAKPATTEDPSKSLEPAVTDPGKKGNTIATKGREYCIECIDNSECISCHAKKINERKFAQSVHGGLSCNGCHWDITDLKSHLKAKGLLLSFKNRRSISLQGSFFIFSICDLKFRLLK